MRTVWQATIYGPEIESRACATRTDALAWLTAHLPDGVHDITAHWGPARDLGHQVTQWGDGPGLAAIGPAAVYRAGDPL